MKILFVFILLICAAVTGRAEDKFARVDELFRDYSGPAVPGGSVIIIQDGRIIYKKAYGMADLEAHVAATTATNYRLASFTKQFTAMCIMMLAERKKLSFDEPLPAFFPDFPAYGKQITVRHLLTHTSGLLDYEDLMPADTKVPILDKGALELLKKQDKTNFPPGSEYRYSNSGFVVLALIVEARSGMSFAQFLKKNIFDPLGMAHTVAFENGISTVSNRAYGYTRREKRYERTDQSMTSSTLGDGGIYTSVDDLFYWDQALYTTKLVKRESLEQAWAPFTLTSGKRTEYGFGWFVKDYRGLHTVQHDGSTIGFRTTILRVPERKFTVIALVNRNEGKPEEIAKKIADLYLF
jgi:CubicO group peptidase (beta-lactamase class C family)